MTKRGRLSPNAPVGPEQGNPHVQANKRPQPDPFERERREVVAPEDGGMPRPLQRPSVQRTKDMMSVPDRPRCGRVYAYLWSRDGHVFTSERTIQHDTGLSERAAADAIFILLERGVAGNQGLKSLSRAPERSRTRKNGIYRNERTPIPAVFRPKWAPLPTSKQRRLLFEKSFKTFNTRTNLNIII